MRNLVYIFLLSLLSSCYEDSELFIPHGEEGPLEALKTLIPSTSQILTLNNDSDHLVVTDYDAQILVKAGTFLAKSEASYELELIEMQNYADFILHNNDHFTGETIFSPFYSIYIGANLNSNNLDLQTDKELIIRVPSQEPLDQIVLGRGSLDQNLLSFDYHIDELSNKIEYKSWTKMTMGGIEITEWGYEFTVNKPGWYSLASTIMDTKGDFEFCISVPDQFDKSNTLVYLLSSDFNFLTRMTSNDYNPSFCSNELKLLDGGAIKLITISEIDGNYYYSENQIVITGTGLEIAINPSLINQSDLKQKILTL